MKTLILIPLASLAALAPASALYGLDYGPTNPGTTTVVTINTTTAAATALFGFSTSATAAGIYRPQGLAYNPNNGHLYSVGEYVVGSTFSSGLYDIDLAAQTASFVPVTGGLNLEGIEFSAAANSLVVTFSPTSFFTNTLGKISTGGVMGTTYGMPTSDSDILGVDPGTGDLLVYDSSNPTSGFVLNRVLSPFGASSAVGLYTGPGNPNGDRDLAAHGGALYLTDGASLHKFSSSLGSEATVGIYLLNTGRTANIVGIADVPGAVPGPLAALPFALGLLRRRRR